MQDKAILVVSEKDNERNNLTQTLKGIGYDNILSAQGGGNAWAFLKSKRIDCVISSYEMEEMSGLALLKILRRENTLGVLHRKEGDVGQALRQYKKALKIHPDEPYIYYNIGRLYLDMKNTTKDKTYFQAALDKDHGFEEAKQVIKAIDLGLV